MLVLENFCPMVPKRALQWESANGEHLHQVFYLQILDSHQSN